MKKLIIINGFLANEYIKRPIVNESNCFDLVLQWAEGVDQNADIVCLCSQDKQYLFSELKTAVIKDSVSSLLSAIERVSKGYDLLYYIHADTPYLDLDISRCLEANHIQYFAEYSFADGYPFGISPEILDPKILGRLCDLAKSDDESIGREAIFKIIQKDINNFDIETDLAPADLRYLRLYLTCDTKRNFATVMNLYAAGHDTAMKVFHHVKDDESLLWSLPAYYQLQLSSTCPQVCTYCPYPQMRCNKESKASFMSFENFQKLIEKIKAYSEDAWVSLSFWGEASLHPQIYEILSYIEQEESLNFLIETSGLAWDLDRLRKHRAENIHWILSLDALNEKTYYTLRGEGMSEAMEFAEFITTLSPRNAYIQAVRMKENERELVDFYRYWNDEKKVNVLIQKYNDFSKNLTERKVCDLSPLVRRTCWHLKREMCIFHDGTVVLCKNDIKRQHVIGNAFSETVPVLWEKFKPYYDSQIKKTYESICRSCDEYYTYNF